MTSIFSRLLLVLMLLGVTYPLHAQEGRVLYEETIKFNIELTPEMQAMNLDIPASRTTKRELWFTPDAMLYRDAPDTTATAERTLQTRDGRVVRRRNRGPGPIVFIDQETGLQTVQRSLMGRTFRIEDEMETLAWKWTDERSTFLGYLCQKATAQRDSTTFEAWFTPEIPVSAGPGYSGLPGLIMVLSVNDGQRSYVAKEMDLAPVDPDLLQAPSEGRAMTREEFEAMRDARLREMESRRGRNGRRFIRARP